MSQLYHEQEKKKSHQPFSTNFSFTCASVVRSSSDDLNLARLSSGDKSSSGVLHIFVANRSPQHILPVTVAKVTTQTLCYTIAP